MITTNSQSEQFDLVKLLQNQVALINGQPEDVAGAILLLATEAASFITGTYVMVNGGSQMI